jgi:hypothetical protein
VNELDLFYVHKMRRLWQLIYGNNFHRFALSLYKLFIRTPPSLFLRYARNAIYHDRIPHTDCIQSHVCTYNTCRETTTIFYKVNLYLRPLTTSLLNTRRVHLYFSLFPSLHLSLLSALSLSLSLSFSLSLTLFLFHFCSPFIFLFYSLFFFKVIHTHILFIYTHIRLSVLKFSLFSFPSIYPLFFAKNLVVTFLTCILWELLKL